MGVAVQYIGQKASKEDNVAGTGLSWAPGQVHVVDIIAAGKLLKHPSVWAVAENVDTAGAEPVAGQGLAPEDEHVEAVLPSFAGMTKQQVVDYALGTFGVTLDTAATKADLVRLVVDLQNVQITAEKLEDAGGVRKVSADVEAKAKTIVSDVPAPDSVPVKVEGFIDPHDHGKVKVVE